MTPYIYGQIIRHGGFQQSPSSRTTRRAERRQSRRDRRRIRRFGDACCTWQRPSSGAFDYGTVWECSTCGSRWTVCVSWRVGQIKKWRRRRLPAWQVTL